MFNSWKLRLLVILCHDLLDHLFILENIHHLLDQLLTLNKGLPLLLLERNLDDGVRCWWLWKVEPTVWFQTGVGVVVGLNFSGNLSHIRANSWTMGAHSHKCIYKVCQALYVSLQKGFVQPQLGEGLAESLHGPLSIWKLIKGGHQLSINQDKFLQLFQITMEAAMNMASPPSLEFDLP